MKRYVDVAIGIVIGIAAAVAVSAFADSPSLDPLKLSPQYYTLRLENDCVRVLEYRLKPGQKEVMHSHSKRVLIALADATVRTTSPDGSVATHPSVNGQVEWSEPLTHAAENTGATEAHYLSVELKGCSR
jgi:hypothetical protein